MTIGTTILDMEHLKKLTAKPKFLAKYYSPKEMKFLMEKSFPIPIMAEMFAAKRAKIIIVAKKYRTAVSCAHNKISAMSNVILYE